MTKLQELPNGQFTLTIPKKLVELKGWKKGLKIAFKDHSLNSLIIEVDVELDKLEVEY